MLYNDRKMMKWQGFILSEHSDQLKQEVEHIEVKPQMPHSTISQLLEYSWEKRYPIRLQLNKIDTDGNITEFEGTVQGFEDGFIFIDGKAYNIEEIRNIEKVDIVKWFK